MQLNQPQLQRHHHRRPPRTDPELAPDIAEVIIHPGFRAIENPADFPRRFAFGTPQQRFFFPGGQGDAGLLFGV
ncbi:hypothetical protein D3C87_1537250 [compost metagenome]